MHCARACTRRKEDNWLKYVLSFHHVRAKGPNFRHQAWSGTFTNWFISQALLLFFKTKKYVFDE